MKDPKFTNILVRFSCPHGTAVHGSARHRKPLSQKKRPVQGPPPTQCRVDRPHLDLPKDPLPHPHTRTLFAHLRCLHTRAHVKNLDCASAAGLRGREVREQSAPSRFRCREQEVEGRRGAPAAPPESGPPPLLSVRSRRSVGRTGPGGGVECSQHGIPAALICSLRSPSAAVKWNWGP